MDISLPQALEEFVREQVESGMYGSRSEVHGEALRLLMSKQGYERKREDLRGAIDLGITQANRGETRACTPEDIIQLSKSRRSAVGGE